MPDFVTPLTMHSAIFPAPINPNLHPSKDSLAAISSAVITVSTISMKYSDDMCAFIVWYGLRNVVSSSKEQVIFYCCRLPEEKMTERMKSGGAWQIIRI